MEKISYKINDFEGPLDLLLVLIKKNKLNIYDIQISELLEQYMNYIAGLKEQNMDVSSEFLEMAARLIYIKTALMLPKHEEAETLKQELTDQLLEYRQYQEIAKKLTERIRFDFISRTAEKISFDTSYSKRHKITELLEAYANCVESKNNRRLPSEKDFSVIISRKFFSVFSKISSILSKLKKEGPISYNSLFYESKSKSEIVATFLAVLELIKDKKVVLSEEGNKIRLLDSGDVEFGRKKS